MSCFNFGNFHANLTEKASSSQCFIKHFSLVQVNNLQTLAHSNTEEELKDEEDILMKLSPCTLSLGKETPWPPDQLWSNSLERMPNGVGLYGAESTKEMADGKVKNCPINFALPFSFSHHYDSSKAPDVSTDFQGIPVCKTWSPQSKTDCWNWEINI